MIDLANKAREIGANKALAKLNRTLRDLGAPYVTRIARERLDSGGYTSGGRYFGRGGPLYCIESSDGRQYYARAGDRWAAMYAHFLNRSHQ